MPLPRGPAAASAARWYDTLNGLLRLWTAFKTDPADLPSHGAWQPPAVRTAEMAAAPVLPGGGRDGGVRGKAQVLHHHGAHQELLTGASGLVSSGMRDGPGGS